MNVLHPVKKKLKIIIFDRPIAVKLNDKIQPLGMKCLDEERKQIEYLNFLKFILK